VASGSAGHSYQSLLLLQHVPIVLPFFIECSSSSETMLERAKRGSGKGQLLNSETMLERAKRGSGKGQLLRLETKEPPHCIAYTLLPHTCINVLHSRNI